MTKKQRAEIEKGHPELEHSFLIENILVLILRNYSNHNDKYCIKVLKEDGATHTWVTYPESYFETVSGAAYGVLCFLDHETEQANHG